MQSNAVRSMWLNQLWEGLHEKCTFKTLPANALVTCGHPSKSARGAEERRRPAEVLVGEWRGNPEEKAFVSIHPERFKNPTEVAKAMLWGAGRAMFGPRGSRKLGIQKVGASLDFTDNELGKEAKAKIKAILDDLGDMPSGKAILEEPMKAKQSTRLRKWVCPGCDLKVRIASDTRGTELIHQPCGEKLIIADTSKEKGE